MITKNDVERDCGKDNESRKGVVHDEIDWNIDSIRASMEERCDDFHGNENENEDSSSDFCETQVPAPSEFWWWTADFNPLKQHCAVSHENNWIEDIVEDPRQNRVHDLPNAVRIHQKEYGAD